MIKFQFDCKYWCVSVSIGVCPWVSVYVREYLCVSVNKDNLLPV